MSSGNSTHRLSGVLHFRQKGLTRWVRLVKNVGTTRRAEKARPYTECGEALLVARASCDDDAGHRKAVAFDAFQQAVVTTTEVVPEAHSVEVEHWPVAEAGPENKDEDSDEDSVDEDPFRFVEIRRKPKGPRSPPKPTRQRKSSIVTVSIVITPIGQRRSKYQPKRNRFPSPATPTPIVPKPRLRAIRCKPRSSKGLTAQMPRAIGAVH
ncbi:hypothetical protein HDZ31DRAFT_64895 [Schizophyllum fasciatum]